MAFDAEEEQEVLDEAPIATRLRSHSKIGDVKISQPQSTKDKPGQSSRDPHAKSKHSTPKKSLVRKASSPLRIGQSSTPSLTKKSSDSTSKRSVHTTSPSRTGQPLTVDHTEKNNESTSKKRVHFSSTCTTSQSSKDQSAKNSKDSALKESETHITSCKTSQLLKDIASSKTSEASMDEGDKNSKDSTPKRSRILISSSGRKSQPSKDHHGTEKKIKDSTPKKNETTSKHLTNPHVKSKDSQPKRESSQYSEKQETKKSKISISKPSPSNVILGQKEENTIPSVKPTNQSVFRAPMYYIRWGGFDKPRTQPAGWNCGLCEKDLAYPPTDENFEHSLPPEVELADIDYAVDEFDDSLLPEVNVLPCNHVFHSMCLQLAASEEQLNGLYCPLCSSWS
ncbi:hypothetical protein L6164_014152 [Bauhinia variegata]|uniref:Uncharacterized protein n=1 Tax=Bauhinia variegata TaxID=167791 RepID=A0ACB9NI46_BAUVA|nr:hypothetical protein L6164_014152 [Bauhinia variegata]